VSRSWQAIDSEVAMRGKVQVSLVALTVAVGLASASVALADSGATGEGLTLAAAGDIACTPGETGVPPDGEPNGPDNCQQAQTAALVESLHPDAVAIPGDTNTNTAC
jgi:hypothetical protein